MKFIKRVAAAFALIVCAYIGFARWEIGKLKRFCSDASPGAPVSILKEAAARHGIEARWLAGTCEPDGKRCFIFAPAASTIGEQGCRITHDGSVILSSKI